MIRPKPVGDMPGGKRCASSVEVKHHELELGPNVCLLLIGWTFLAILHWVFT